MSVTEPQLDHKEVPGRTVNYTKQQKHNNTKQAVFLIKKLNKFWTLWTQPVTKKEKFTLLWMISKIVRLLKLTLRYQNNEIPISRTSSSSADNQFT